MTKLNTELIRMTAAFLFCAVLLSCSSDYEFEYLYKDLPFEMDRVKCPDIPPREINITDFGGVGDDAICIKSGKVSNCRFLGTDVGLRFKSCRGRGGVVGNISISPKM